MLRRRVALAALLALSCLGAPRLGEAQAPAQEGALFLLVPFGARMIGRGQAGVSVTGGSDGAWWNPASLGWSTRREVSFEHASNFFIQTAAAFTLVIPAGRAGVVGGSVHYFNYGDQDGTDEFGNIVSSISAGALVATATYGATFGDRVSAGVAYKFLRQSQSCSGLCGDPTLTVSTSAFDAGMQYVADSARRLTLGAAVRNFGIGLQTIDREQTDPLPTRLHLGLTYAIPELVKSLPGAEFEATGEIVAKPLFQDPELRVGAELRLAGQLIVRGGMLGPISNPGGGGGGDGSSGVIGLGYRRGTISLDFARSIGGESADAGKAPTYVTLRLAFR